jgi:hypothetical protein
VLTHRIECVTAKYLPIRFQIDVDSACPMGESPCCCPFPEALWRAPAGVRAEALQRDFAVGAPISHSSPAGRSNHQKKIFLSDYPRGVTNCFWLWSLPSISKLPVTPGLPVALLFPYRRLAVSLLRFPPRPFPHRFPAVAAIPLSCLPGKKALLASFEQIAARSRPAFHSLPLRRLFSERPCRTLGSVQGR